MKSTQFSPGIHLDFGKKSGQKIFRCRFSTYCSFRLIKCGLCVVIDCRQSLKENRLFSIRFTMSIFIANVAFAGNLLNGVNRNILIADILSAWLGLMIIYVVIEQFDSVNLTDPLTILPNRKVGANFIKNQK